MKYIVIFLLAITSLSGWAQETENERKLKRLRGAIFMANSYVPEATEGGQSIYVMPVWGVDLDYQFSNRWALGIQTDVKVQSFEVEDGNAILERSYPLAIAGVVYYHLKRHWTVYLGPGYEFEKHKSIFLMKFGMEYSFELTEKFELGVNLQYENKSDIYDNLTVGVAFNFLLWEEK